MSTRPQALNCAPSSPSTQPRFRVPADLSVVALIILCPGLLLSPQSDAGRQTYWVNVRAPARPCHQSSQFSTKRN